MTASRGSSDPSEPHERAAHIRHSGSLRGRLKAAGKRLLRRLSP